MRDPAEQLRELDSQHLRRRLRPLDSAQGPVVSRDGRELVNFASNDYLGFARHPELIESFQRGLERWGVGSGSSRLLAGSLPPHQALEESVARFKGSEAALSFSSGYAANIGILSALLEKGDVVLMDKLAHASLIDGARLSGAVVRSFPHNRLDKLESLLKKYRRELAADRRLLIVTEAVFSMDGDRCLLAEMIELKQRYGAWLLLDEAHSFGVVGERGAGLAAELGVTQEVDFQMGTFSKAAGLSGAYLAASAASVDWLVNRARSFIYSTAPPPALAEAARRAIDLIQSEAGRMARQCLQSHLDQFEKATGLASESAIVPYPVGEAQRALELASAMEQAGFITPAVRYPTVPRQQARLRISFSASHQSEQIQALAEALKKFQASS